MRYRKTYEAGRCCWNYEEEERDDARDLVGWKWLGTIYCLDCNRPEGDFEPIFVSRRESPVCEDCGNELYPRPGLRVGW